MMGTMQGKEGNARMRLEPRRGGGAAGDGSSHSSWKLFLCPMRHHEAIIGCVSARLHHQHHSLVVSTRSPAPL